MAGARHILVVDDSADFREGLRAVLEDQGCAVSEAANGKIALHILCTVLPHLILFDLEMPVMNGWEFYAELQKDPVLAAIPIGVLSSGFDRRPVGSMHVLGKPLNLNKLRAVLCAIDLPNGLA
jgi:CheY-like chemotaxis protein